MNDTPAQEGQPAGPDVFVRMARPKPTSVFNSYWKFASHRHAIYEKRLAGRPWPWTTDPILQQYKFTNAFRACDRTSQYLIRDVIYAHDRSGINTIFRTLLFKLFNKIETWKLLERQFGNVNYDDFDWRRCDKVLTDAKQRGERIYSPAYIMPPASNRGSSVKHRTHLALLRDMMVNHLPEQLLSADTFAQGFDLLISYRGIGPFLAYQFMTDLNYSAHFPFSEMEFIVPGPGARDGLAKCFSDLGDYTESNLIHWVTEQQATEFAKAELPACTLGHRPLQLVDCQNLFCEIGKYARVAHPEVPGRSGRKRIKQQFRPSRDPCSAWFPPKWQIDERTLKSTDQS